MAAFDLTPVLGTVDQLISEPFGGDQKFRLSQWRHLLVDQGLPSYTELVRAGKVFTACGGVVANAVVPVVDVPTTAAGQALYNGNPQGVPNPVYLVPIRVASYAASGTLGLGRTLMVGVSPTIQAAAVAKGTGVIGPNNNNPASANVSNAVLGTTVTLAGTPAWASVAGLDTPAAVEIGASLNADIFGMYLVPPGFAFGMHNVAPLGTLGKFLFTITFAELVLAGAQ